MLRNAPFARARWIGLSGVVIALDQISKLCMLAHFHRMESLAITPFFNLFLVFNPGASFSLLADAGGWQKWFFIALALGVSLWLLMLLRQHAQERLFPAAISLVLGGALGNVIDRLRLDAVVDFLDFHLAGHHFPAFNVADSAISIGVALMLIHQFRHQETP
ncbi:peptidase A8 [Rugosibacter aromaticivorans]|uniref:Lipoprotein signal peptidase n=1 Tax=Rugosibacter aromaticivorans TaxID=1565605 RepID=A0A0C5JCY3_9PROT|nr:peptidase A8 [Rugosibacter aromaticivorans]